MDGLKNNSNSNDQKRKKKEIVIKIEAVSYVKIYGPVSPSKREWYLWLRVCEYNDGNGLVAAQIATQFPKRKNFVFVRLPLMAHTNRSVRPHASTQHLSRNRMHLTNI